jgi:hypothetical protein
MMVGETQPLDSLVTPATRGTPGTPATRGTAIRDTSDV